MSRKSGQSGSVSAFSQVRPHLMQDRIGKIGVEYTRSGQSNSKQFLSTSSPYRDTQNQLISFQKMNPHLYKRGPTKYQKSQVVEGKFKAKGHWTEEEDTKLTKAVEIYGGKNWKKIAANL